MFNILDDKICNKYDKIILKNSWNSKKKKEKAEICTIFLQIAFCEDNIERCFFFRLCSQILLNFLRLIQFYDQSQKRD